MSLDPSYRSPVAPHTLDPRPHAIDSWANDDRRTRPSHAHANDRRRCVVDRKAPHTSVSSALVIRLRPSSVHATSRRTTVAESSHRIAKGASGRRVQLDWVQANPSKEVPDRFHRENQGTAGWGGGASETPCTHVIDQPHPPLQRSAFLDSNRRSKLDILVPRGACFDEEEEEAHLRPPRSENEKKNERFSDVPYPPPPSQSPTVGGPPPSILLLPRGSSYRTRSSIT